MSEKPGLRVRKMNAQEIIDVVEKTPGSSRHPQQFWSNPYRFLRFRIDVMIYDDDASMVQSQIDVIHKMYNESGKNLEDIPNPLMRTYLDTSVEYRERIICFMKIMKLSNLRKSAMQAWLDNERTNLDSFSEKQFGLKTIEATMNEVYIEE
jgi:hypothetical protein